jgi:hypothetical protein
MGGEETAMLTVTEKDVEETILTGTKQMRRVIASTAAMENRSGEKPSAITASVHKRFFSPAGRQPHPSRYAWRGSQHPTRPPIHTGFHFSRHSSAPATPAKLARLVYFIFRNLATLFSQSNNC